MTFKCFFGAGMVILVGMAFSCGGAVTRKSTVTTPSSVEKREQVGDSKENRDYLMGLAKIQENDCSSCHALERKSVGPSYAAVAAKYEATEEVVDVLAQRIISGSVGIWGEIPMTAHYELSIEDAKQMVKFVFTLKK